MSDFILNTQVPFKAPASTIHENLTDYYLIRVILLVLVKFPASIR